MENKTPNTAIECSVKECQNHCGSENYCALRQIRVSSHETNPTVSQCTDCESFVMKSDCDSCR